MRHWVHALVPSFGRRIERSQSVHINIKQGITSSYSNNIQLRPGKPNSWETETWTPRAHSPLQGILVDVATWPRCCQSFFIRTLWVNSLRSVNTWTLQSFNNKTQKVSKLWIVFSNPTQEDEPLPKGQPLSKYLGLSKWGGPVCFQRDSIRPPHL